MKTILSAIRKEETNHKKANEQLEKKLLTVVKKENDELCERMSSIQRIADIHSTVIRSKRSRCRLADQLEQKRREFGDDHIQQPMQELGIISSDRNLFLVEDFSFYVCFIYLEGNGIGTKMEESSSATDVELTDTAFEATPGYVKQRIEDEVMRFLELLGKDEEPAMLVTSRGNNNAIFCKKEKHIRLGKTTVKRKLSNGKRYQGVWKVLQVCYTLMKEQKSVNQRELYYLNTDVTLLLYVQRRCSQLNGNVTIAYVTVLLFFMSRAMRWGSQRLQKDMFLEGTSYFIVSP